MVIFESGDYVEFSFGSVIFSVIGVGLDVMFIGIIDLGNVVLVYIIFGMGMCI